MREAENGGGGGSFVDAPDERSRVSVSPGQQPVSLEASSWKYRVPTSINPVNRTLVNSHFARRF